MRRNCASLRLLLGVLLLLPLFILACGGDETVVEKFVPTPPPTTGSIEGDVGVPGASVTLNPGGLQATTDSQGKFSFQDVDVGAYSLTVAATGYNTVTRSNVIVVGGSTTNLIFDLLAVGTAPAKVIGEDETIQLTPADFGAAGGPTLSDWRSSNNLVAVVNESGEVLGTRKGNALISAVRSDNGALVSLRVAVVQTLTPFGYVNAGSPVTSAQAGYIGSDRCSACHPGQFDEWKLTGHNMMVRAVNQPGLSGQSIVADANNNGINDFVEGLNLATSSASPGFAVYGANAPKIGYSDDGNYTITIGPVTYNVALTVGGNGYWKQRYLVRLGNSHYFSPVQYNEITKQYVPYGPSDWYDTANQPRYQNPATVAQSYDKTKSWERRCAGCHVTGTRVAFDDASGQWEAGYVQTSVGCEACHGPASDHPQAAISGAADKKIVNPAKLSRQAANDLCGSCHTRGSSADTLGGQTFGFPAVVQGDSARSFRPGLDVLSDFTNVPYFGNDDLYTVTQEASAYWGIDAIWRGAHGGTPAPYQTFVASKDHHQQFLDYLQSAHGQSDNVQSCAACHDPHSQSQEWSIVSEITDSDCVGSFCQSECTNPQEDVTIQTQTDDNSLCLACHANWGPFRSLCKDDVNNDRAKVGQVVKAHMGTEILMGNVPYDPENTGLGRCSECHLPMMAESAVTSADADGKAMGDVNAHTFEIVWPSVNARIDSTMPNTCSLCHSSADTSPGLVALAQWRSSGHADITANHWTYSAGPDRQDCVRCHSGFGFVDFLAGVPEADRNTTPKIHSCYTCHDPQEDIPYNRRPVASVTFPSGFTTNVGGDALICLNCHQGRTWIGTVNDAVAKTGSDFGASTLNSHYRLAGAVLYGTEAQEGYEYPGKTYRGEHFHVELTRSDSAGNCVACHMSETAAQEEVGGHSWAMVEGSEQNSSLCINCHGNIGPFQQYQIFNRDYDGNGVVQGMGQEVQGLKDILLAALQARGLTKLDAYPYWTPGTGGPWDGPSGPALKKAAYNYLFVEHDPGAYVHNGKFAVQLLRDSYEDLTGSTLPGVRP